jgi:hypothetical protein
VVTASGRVREMKDAEHLKGFGIEVGEVKYDREKVAAHAAQVNLLYSYKSTNTDTLLDLLVQKYKYGHLTCFTSTQVQIRTPYLLY